MDSRATYIGLRSERPVLERLCAPVLATMPAVLPYRFGCAFGHARHCRRSRHPVCEIQYPQRNILHRSRHCIRDSHSGMWSTRSVPDRRSICDILPSCWNNYTLSGCCSFGTTCKNDVAGAKGSLSVSFLPDGGAYFAVARSGTIADL